MKIESLALKDLRLSPIHCHRNAVKLDRIEKLANRLENLVQLPPLRGWRAPDGAVVLTDGFHRYLALRKLDVPAASVLVWYGTWPEALVQALLANRPRNGSRRMDQDAERALLILAHALGRPVTPEEANSLGLEWCEHSLPSQDIARTIRLPAELEVVVTVFAHEARAAGINHPPRRTARGGDGSRMSRRT